MALSLPVYGVNLDTQTRCQHYRGTTDIIAIKMRCCRVYYACEDCHSALANHPTEVWQESEWDQKAILCGACGTELMIHEYMASESRCQAWEKGIRDHLVLLSICETCKYMAWTSSISSGREKRTFTPSRRIGPGVGLAMTVQLPVRTPQPARPT
jgi:uncharacterized CHY-type Zn-finger protein